MNCGIAPDVSFFYSSLVPYLPRVCLSLLAAGSHKFCSQCWPRRVTLPASLLCTASRASLDPSPGYQAAPTPGFILVFLPESTGWPNRRVELEPLTSWPGGACSGCCRAEGHCPAVSHSPGPSPHTIPSPLRARGSVIRHRHPACLSQRDSKVTVTPQGTKQLLQACQGDVKIK